ncbi:MAG: cytochrome c oxidase subunit 3 family protein, partial [Verrucomicrobia bacterium]|nr:cytochrome c oxidase subunit 3 family protein [Verrucomicrobiota bacterium]
MEEDPIQHHFETAEQQRDAAALGMWIFLGTEVLFFGALFMAYTYLRWANPVAV